MDQSHLDHLPEHFHSVQFYKDPDALCRIVGAFIGEGLRQGNPALVVATPAHKERIDASLQERGLDVSTLKHDGQLTVLDAADTLSLFMVEGMPNAGAFRWNVGEIMRQISKEHGGRPLRAYGEMVDVLWRDGQEAAAIRLETLWNQLADSHEFKLLCGYSMGHFYKRAALEKIKAQHSHLTSDTGTHAAIQ